MSRSRVALAAALALAGVAAAPSLPTGATTSGSLPDGCRQASVAAQDGNEQSILLCESQQFIAAGAAPVSNVTAARLSPDEPTAPIGGAGLGGSVTDIVLQGDPAHGLEVVGTFTGPLDSLDVEVYLAMPNGELEQHGVTPQLEVDGFNFGGQLLDATVTTGDSGVQRLRFRIDDMVELWPLLQFDLAPDAEHSLRLNLSPYYIGDDGAYLYGGTEVPSNVVLNGTS